MKRTVGGGMRRRSTEGWGDGGVKLGGKEAGEAGENKGSQWMQKNFPWLVDWRSDLVQVGPLCLSSHHPGRISTMLNERDDQPTNWPAMQILHPIEDQAVAAEGSEGATSQTVRWSKVDKAIFPLSLPTSALLT